MPSETVGKNVLLRETRRSRKKGRLTIPNQKDNRRRKEDVAG